VRRQEEYAENQSQFLLALNALWNDYARDLLLGRRRSDRSPENDDGADISRRALSRLAEVKSEIEWTGALMRVEECLQNPTWVGREGVLVGETSRVWKFVEVDQAAVREVTAPSNSGTADVQQEQRDSQRDPPGESGEVPEAAAKASALRIAQQRQRNCSRTRKSKKCGEVRGMKSYIVPKQHSAVVLLIPLDRRALRILLKESASGIGGWPALY